MDNTVLDRLTSKGAEAPFLKYFHPNCGHIFKDLSQARALYTLGQNKVCRKSGYLGPTYGNRAFDQPFGCLMEASKPIYDAYNIFLA